MVAARIRENVAKSEPCTSGSCQGAGFPETWTAMSAQHPTRSRWRLAVALLVAAAATLAALVAVRGPDWIGPVVAEAVGGWRLGGPSVWHPLTPLALLAEGPHSLAGPRGWQNLHVVVAWLTLMCWLLGLPAKAWRGLAPIGPALVAVVLSVPAAGLAGFGAGLLVLSGWCLFAARADARLVGGLWPVAAWLAAWFSPGLLPVVVAAAATGSVRWTSTRRWLAAGLGLLAVNLTPRGTAVWSEMWLFLRWSPQTPLTAPALVALIVTLAVFGVAIRASYKDGRWSRVVAPGLLVLCASAGQSAYLWAAALWMIPCWPAAREHIQRFGFRVRWWMQLTTLILTGLLVLLEGRVSLPRWYDLAMTEAAISPTLTREALPDEGAVYINPRGRPLARFSGALPDEGAAPGALHFGREPSLWRAHDRAVRYRAVWLLGDKVDFAPLARHLGDSPDWRLEAVDATGVLFVRARRQDVFATEPAQEMARRMTGGANRAGFLGRAALSCLAAQALPEAGELSATALRRSDESSFAPAARARVLISLGLPREALDFSALAIERNPSSAEAWQVRAETLLHAGLTDNAYAAARRAAELAPGDAGALWLAARAANAARAWQSEAETLEQLVALTTARGGDAGFYRLYLGQSYARQGLTRPAVRNLQAAAESPGISEEQKRSLQEEIDGLLSAPGAF